MLQMAEIQAKVALCYFSSVASEKAGVYSSERPTARYLYTLKLTGGL
jgi:hypothetical protein